MKKIIVLCSIVLLLMPFAALGQDFCEGNFDYDRDQDGTDAFTFKTDFGRSGIVDPCPPDGPAPASMTGQTVIYAERDDADLMQGVAWPDPRFTDNGDGTVKDNLTGLFWLKNANCFGARTWDQALSDCNALASGSCGLTDGSTIGAWRLPNVRELFSLIDFGQISPGLPSGHPFSNVQTSSYWSSTTSPITTANAYYVGFNYGFVITNDKSTGAYVLPVCQGH